MVKKDGMSVSMPQGGNDNEITMAIPTYAKCWKKYDGKCLSELGVFYGCSMNGHQLKNYPTHTEKRINISKTSQRGS